METIIQQIMQSVVQKMLKRIQEKKTLDEWATETLEDCKAMAIEIAQVCCDEMNKEIRKNKSSRKEKGLVLKEKERKRSLLTVLGNIQIHRDYYYDTINNCYITPLDYILGLRPYERIGEEICARLVQESTEVSYAKSAKIVCDSMVSRQSVRNCILKVNLPQVQEKEVPKKSVPELHIYADKDHVHLQKSNKQKGKKMQIVPLVTITEGTMKQTESRNKTIKPVHFVHQHFDTKELWRDVDQYIWEGIVHRKTLDIPGSCTEGQVSHVLSTGKDFQRMESMSSSIGEEAKENLRNKPDWSIFDGEPWIFDRKSGTQILLHAIGKAGKDKIC